MRLIDCYIENFGKLSQKPVTFLPGCNIICEENGWGKSTLAAFIRVMFYGFENEKSRDELKNERKRYRPWQGGVYGGRLTFEAGGERYVIERTFGTKEKEDCFKLRIQSTNLESDRYGAAVGEELFQLDSQSFCRTVFLSQRDCITSVTDDIHAKIGDLALTADDMNRYDTVHERLTGVLNQMSPMRKTGSLSKMKEELGRLQEIVRGRQSLGEAIEDAECRIRGKISEQKERRAEQAALLCRQREISAGREIRAKRAAYEGLCREAAERRRRLDGARAFFPGDLPRQAELERYLTGSAELTAMEQTANVYRLTQEEAAEKARLEGGPGSGEGAALPDREELEALIAEWSVCIDRQRDLEKKQAAYQMRTEAAQAASKKDKAQKNRLSAGIAAGILTGAAGLALALWKGLPSGLLAVAAGVVLAVFFLAGKRKQKDMGQAPPGEDAAALRREIEKDKQYIANVRGKAETVLAGEGIGCTGEGEILQGLHRVRETLQRYAVLTEKEENFCRSMQEYRETRDGLQAYLRTLFLVPEQDLHGQLLVIQRHLQTVQSCLSECEKAEKEKKDFEQAENTDLLRQEIPQEPVEGEERAIAERLREIDQESDRLYEQRIRDNRELDRLREEWDKTQEAAESLTVLQETYDRERKKYQLLKQTRAFLEQAKISFTAKYMRPMLESFGRYYTDIAGGDAGRYHMDANMEITADEAGMQREMRFFSEGYRDLTGICMRMALVEAMYREEKPFVIFDDPFASLDDRKLKGALAFLEKTAQTYQILYFTCQESRGHANDCHLPKTFV